VLRDQSRHDKYLDPLLSIFAGPGHSLWSGCWLHVRIYVQISSVTKYLADSTLPWPAYPHTLFDTELQHLESPLLALASVRKSAVLMHSIIQTVC
jgi:hypothetical protein